MPTLAVTQQLSIGVAAADGGLALYFGELNQLTVTVTNCSANSITLKGGAPVRESDARPGGPAAFYVMFGGALSSNQISQIQLKKTMGWNPGTFFDGAFPAVALVPQTDVLLAPRASIELVLTNIVVTGRARGATLSVDFVNVPGAPQDSTTFEISTQDRPAAGVDLPLQSTLVGDGIVLLTQNPANPMSNTLTVRLLNDTGTAIAIPPSAAFNIWFLYGKGHGYNALATPDEAKQINLQAVRIGAQSRDPWPPQINDDDSGRRWTLSSATPLAIEPRGAIELTFDSIVSTLGPGPTAVYIQHAGFAPAYNDGYHANALEKRAPAPGIAYFRLATPNIIDAGEPVAFTWQTVGVTSLSLSYKNRLQNVTLSSDHGDIPLNAPAASPFHLPAPPLVDTAYYLEALMPAGTPPVPSIVLSVTTPPVRIAAFGASPPAADFATGPANITLSWDVQPRNLVKQLLLELDSVTSPIDVTGQTSYVVANRRAAGPVKLTAFGLGGDQTVRVLNVPTLQAYLVGRRFGLDNRHQAYHGDICQWSSSTTDDLHFDASASASYSVSCTEQFGEWQIGGRGLSKSWSGASLPWGVNGTIVAVGCALGLLQLQFTNSGTLRFLNPPKIPGMNPTFMVRNDTEMRQQ